MQAMFTSEKDQQNNDWTLDSLDYDARENLLGFYELLLKIRMRNDRKKYGEKKEDKC